MRAIIKLNLLMVIFFVTLSAGAEAKGVLKGSSDDIPYEVEMVADGLRIPWGMTFISPENLLITERQGTVKLLNVETKNLSAIAGAPHVFAKGQGGLLDVKVSPNYETDRWLYFTYSKPQKEGAATTLARAQLVKQTLVGWQDLLVTKPASTATKHFGSRVAFDRDGHVFFGVGDRGDRPNAQDLRSHAGTIMRLNLNGSVPTDNPFTGRDDALPEIWSYGHRNPQGLVFDHSRQILWEIEHGPRGGDEINIIRPGRNYGWPVISYGKEYWGPLDVGEGTEKKGMEQPFKYYVPSIAPSSLHVYQGNAFPQWRGDLFAGALVLTHLNRIKLDASGKALKEERLLDALGERIRSIEESKQGWLYLSTDSGKILRIVPRD